MPKFKQSRALWHLGRKLYSFLGSCSCAHLNTTGALITEHKCKLLFLFMTVSIYPPAFAIDGELETLQLRENGFSLTLHSDGTCQAQSADIVTLPKDNNHWNEILNISSLDRLSGLAILEQVKLQVSATRIVIPFDSDNETQLTLHYANKHPRTISLYSVNLMHQTYPNAALLGDFMALLTTMRNAETYCQ